MQLTTKDAFYSNDIAGKLLAVYRTTSLELPIVVVMQRDTFYLDSKKARELKDWFLKEVI